MKLLTLIASLCCFLQSAPQTIPIGNAWCFGPSSGLTQSSMLYAGYGGTFSQTLTVSPAKLQEYYPGYFNEGVYVLKFSVANWFPAYPGYYTAEIDFGTQELCEASGWGTRTFTEVVLTCPAAGYIVADKSLPGGGPVQGAKDFVIHFAVNDGSPNGGWPVLFDNISLTYTSEAK